MWLVHMSSASRLSVPAQARISHRPRARIAAAIDRATRTRRTPATCRRRGAAIVPVELIASILAAFARARRRRRLGTAKQRALASRHQAMDGHTDRAWLTCPRAARAWRED